MISPCIKVCVLSENNICTGCFRTLDEIKTWTKMTDLKRHEICERIKLLKYMKSESNKR
jgi:predicted Fe-S protein YdhL (DUF1289 family)